MTNLPKTLEEALKMFDEKFEGVLEKKFISKDPRVPPITIFVKDQLKSFLTLFWHAAQEEAKKEMIEPGAVIRAIDEARREEKNKEETEKQKTIGVLELVCENIAEVLVTTDWDNRNRVRALENINGQNKILSELINKIKEKNI